VTHHAVHFNNNDRAAQLCLGEVLVLESRFTPKPTLCPLVHASTTASTLLACSLSVASAVLCRPCQRPCCPGSCRPLAHRRCVPTALLLPVWPCPCPAICHPELAGGLCGSAMASRLTVAGLRPGLTDDGTPLEYAPPRTPCAPHALAHLATTLGALLWRTPA